MVAEGYNYEQIRAMYLGQKSPEKKRFREKDASEPVQRKWVEKK